MAEPNERDREVAKEHAEAREPHEARLVDDVDFADRQADWLSAYREEIAAKLAVAAAARLDAQLADARATHAEQLRELEQKLQHQLTYSCGEYNTQLTTARDELAAIDCRREELERLFVQALEWKRRAEKTIDRLSVDWTIARERAERAEAELAAARADVVAAAGELLVPLPQPGTDGSRIMLANVAMRRERDIARKELAEARATIHEIADALGYVSWSDDGRFEQISDDQLINKASAIVKYVDRIEAALKENRK